MKKILLIFILLFSIQLVHGSSEGLVSEYIFNGSVNDRMGLNNGTIVGSLSYVNVTVNSTSMPGLRFIGSDSNYVRIEDSPSLYFNRSFTIIVGEVPYGNVSKVEQYVSKYNTTSNLRELFVQREATSGYLSTTISNTTGTTGYGTNSNVNIGVDSTPVIFASSWNADADSGKMFLYVNGVETGYSIQTNSTYSLHDTANPLLIGRYGSTTGRAVNGTIFYVGLWNRSLNASEISTITANLQQGIYPSDNVVSDPCVYSGSGDFIQNNTVCNITQNVNIQEGYSWIIQNSTVYSNSTISGGKGWNWISGALHFLKW